MSLEENTTRGEVLEVPFSEKDEAKKLGAKWDPDMRKWFVPRGTDVKRFEKWRRTIAAPKTDSVK